MFSPEVNSLPIDVRILADTIAEGEETFLLVIAAVKSSPSIELSNSIATMTIEDDDGKLIGIQIDV